MEIPEGLKNSDLHADSIRSLREERFTACYLPKLSEGQRDPSREFDTEQEAWNYIFENMCDSCCESRRRALEGDEEFSDHPACSAEWFVIPSNRLENVENFQDLLEAAGCNEVIYRRAE